MVVGVLGAIAQDDMKRILSFHIVSQIGYMIMGLGLFTVAGLAGAVFYVIHHIVGEDDPVPRRPASSSCTPAAVDWLASEGSPHRAPLLGVLFLVPALSLAGLPPFSGFVAKLALVDAGLAREAVRHRRGQPRGQPVDAVLDDQDLGQRVLGRAVRRTLALRSRRAAHRSRHRDSWSAPPPPSR